MTFFKSSQRHFQYYVGYRMGWCVDRQVFGCVGARICASSFLPDGDIVGNRLSLQQCEVDVDTMSMGYSDEPGAVLGVGILVWVVRRIDGPILSCDVVATRSCGQTGKEIVNMSTCWMLTLLRVVFMGNVDYQYSEVLRCFYSRFTTALNALMLSELGVTLLVLWQEISNQPIVSRDTTIVCG